MLLFGGGGGRDSNSSKTGSSRAPFRPLPQAETTVFTEFYLRLKKEKTGPLRVHSSLNKKEKKVFPNA